MPTKIYMYLVKKQNLDPTKVCASTVFLNINCKISSELIDYIFIKKRCKMIPKRETSMQSFKDTLQCIIISTLHGFFP